MARMAAHASTSQQPFTSASNSRDSTATGSASSSPSPSRQGHHHQQVYPNYQRDARDRQGSFTAAADDHQHRIKYQQAPYAASRTASLYGMGSEADFGGSSYFPGGHVPAPAALLDQSHLQPGALASLLSHEKTLDLYRANAKKTNDPDVQFEFCTFVMDVVGEMQALAAAASDDSSATGSGSGSGSNGRAEDDPVKLKQQALVAESVALLSKLAHRGHVASQYFLADCYTQGVGTSKGKRDYDKAYPLFLLAGKHGHADACFRAAQCCEHGWGCQRAHPKAVSLLRRAAVLSHPSAMHRLGLAELNGELGLSKRPREGVKWLKRAAELADVVDPPQPQSLHELALLSEKGIDNVIFKDEEYAAELLARASELHYAPSAYKLGECYEYGKMGCPQDAALSIHYYNIAAQQDHREACFALTAWYLVGSPGVLPQSDTEAFLWAKKAADMGLAKAQYAVGYFTEVGIGTFKDNREALEWFRKAAEQGDKRARDRLLGAQNGGPPPPHSANNYGRPAPRQQSTSSATRPDSSLPPPPPSKSYKPPPITKLNGGRRHNNSNDGSTRGSSVDRGHTARKSESLGYGQRSNGGAFPPMVRQRSSSQPAAGRPPAEFGGQGGYVPTAAAYGNGGDPYSQYGGVQSGQDLQTAYGRPLPNPYEHPQGSYSDPNQHLHQSEHAAPSGHFKPIQPGQVRMPPRQQQQGSNPILLDGAAERDATRDRVLQKKKTGDDKDCVIM